jgi:hypothetical protein
MTLIGGVYLEQHHVAKLHDYMFTSKPEYAGKTWINKNWRRRWPEIRHSSVEYVVLTKFKKQNLKNGSMCMKIHWYQMLWSLWKIGFCSWCYCCFQKSWHSRFDVTFLVICGLKQRIILTHWIFVQLSWVYSEISSIFLCPGHATII